MLGSLVIDTPDSPTISIFIFCKSISRKVVPTGKSTVVAFGISKLNPVTFVPVPSSTTIVFPISLKVNCLAALASTVG